MLSEALPLPLAACGDLAMGSQEPVIQQWMMGPWPKEVEECYGECECCGQTAWSPLP